MDNIETEGTGTLISFYDCTSLHLDSVSAAPSHHMVTQNGANLDVCM